MRNRLVVRLVVAAMFGLPASIPASAQSPPDLPVPIPIPRPIESAPVRAKSFVGDLRRLPKVGPEDPNVLHPEGYSTPEFDRPKPGPGPPASAEPADAPDVAAVGPDSFVTPSIDFEGLAGGNPPDPTGDVGPDHYVQMVNTRFAVYSKTGSLLSGPVPINSLWSGRGGLCEDNNDGDPIVVYDEAADRFLLSQFAITSTVHALCVAISKTADPVTGGYWLYELSTPNLPDYPKFGVWPDAYYVSTFEGTELGAYALDRDKMLVGAPATSIRAELSDADAVPGKRGTRLLPSDWDGMLAPPPGEPNHFVRSVDGAVNVGSDRLEVYDFHVDFDTPANSTFALVDTMATAPFDSDLCGFFRDCIPQPDTNQRVDALSNRLMWRLQYRNFGTHQAMVTNQTVDVGSDLAGIRWYELRKTSPADWGIFQQGTYAPDGKHRFVGSAAMDASGNIALGYSVSRDRNVFPSLRYVGRLNADPLGTLPQGEATLVSGTASETFSNRWGDYSHMAVDPTDDCTFWFTGQYAGQTGNFLTRIGSFRFPSCQAPPTGLTISKTAAPASSVSPGSNLTYTVAVTNNTASSLPGVTLTDPVPSGTTFVSVAGPDCEAPAVGSGPPAVVECEAATMAPGSSFTVTLVVAVGSSASGTVTNTATVTSGANMASDTVSVNVGGGSCAATGDASVTAPGVVSGSGVFGTTGDCTTVNGGRGKDRITIGEHSATLTVNAGAGKDRICADNASTDVINGQDGTDKAASDPTDTLNSVKRSEVLDCTG